MEQDSFGICNTMLDFHPIGLFAHRRIHCRQKVKNNGRISFFESVNFPLAFS